MKQKITIAACLLVALALLVMVAEWWINAKLGDRIAMACLLVTVAVEAAIWGSALWWYGHDPFQLWLRQAKEDQAYETAKANAKKPSIYKEDRRVQTVAR